MTPRHVVVIGAGITGLTAAYWLQHHARARGQALQVTVLESGQSVGGHVHTVCEDGFIVEAGPNGFLDREPSMTALVQSLGLDSRLIEARPEAARRFIVRGGRLCLVPQSPASLLRTPALSLRGRLRMLYEPFAKGPTPGVEETVSNSPVVVSGRKRRTCSSIPRLPEFRVATAGRCRPARSSR